MAQEVEVDFFMQSEFAVEKLGLFMVLQPFCLLTKMLEFLPHKVHIQGTCYAPMMVNSPFSTLVS